MRSTKKSENVYRAQLLVNQLLHHTGKSLAELERILEVGPHGELPGERGTTGDAGETLIRWRDGRAKNVKLRTIQEIARVAYAKGMLPPLHRAGLQHRDVFLLKDQTLDADVAWTAETKHRQRLEKLQSAAVKAIQDFAAALEADEELLIFDTSVNEDIELRSAEIEPREVQVLADNLRAIRYFKMHSW